MAEKELLTPKRRENLAKIATNASTIVLATLVLGNVVSGRPFMGWLFWLGTGVYVALVLVVLWLEK